jgi:hypothetical protein
MRNHPLVAYFVLAYAGSWIVLIPAILAFRATCLTPGSPRSISPRSPDRL